MLCNPTTVDLDLGHSQLAASKDGRESFAVPEWVPMPYVAVAMYDMIALS